jgi:hypothetical protein
LFTRDLNGNEFLIQTTATYENELNGNQTLTFKLSPSKVNDPILNDISEMWGVVDDEGTEYKIVYFKKRGEGERLTIDVKAVPLFFDKFESERVYETYNQHMTANTCFNLIFADSGFNFSLVGTFYAVQWEGFGKGETRLSLFKKAIERYKAEFEIQGNTIYLNNLIGRDTQFPYRYRLNASNIQKEHDATAFYTYAKGFGNFAEGEEDKAALVVEYTSPLAAIMGIRHAPPTYDGRVVDTEVMKASLKTLVDDSLKISVSTDIHDLRKQGYALAQPMVGDRVFLIDERIGLNDEVRVIDMKITKDWKGDVLDLKLVLGSPNIVKRHQSNLQTAVERITELVEGRGKLPFNVLDNAVLEATKALQSAQTELEFVNGIIAREKTNPNEVVIYNSKGIFVSVDGGATPKTAMTARGVVADVITSGHLNSNNVTVGNGKVSLNDEGIFVYKNNVLGASLVEGNLTFNDQTNAQQIGRFAATVWSDGTTKGISMNMEQNRYISFGQYVNETEGYAPMMLLNPSSNMAGNVQGIHMNLPIRMNRDVWLGVNSLRFGENNNHNHSSLWHSANDNLNIGSYTGVRLGYLTSGGVMNDRLTVGSNTVDAWQDLDMHGWKLLRVGEVQQSSSMLLKTNVQDYEESALDVINNLQVKKFHFQSDIDQGNFYNEQIGLISELSPEVANFNQTAIQFTKLPYLNTKAIQELHEKVELLLDRMDNVELILGGA